jgi:hypothetical protein
VSEFEPVSVFQWVQVVKRMRLGRTLKAVAIVYSTYADGDTGLNVRPGTARVAVEAEVSYDTAKACTAKLRAAGLLRKAGRWGNTTMYRLALPDAGNVPVPNPAQHEAAIGKVRASVRGTYKPGTENLRVVEHPADASADPLPASPDPVCGGNDYPQIEGSAGGETPRRNESAAEQNGPAGSETPRYLLTTHLEVVPTSTLHSDNDLFAAVTDPSGPGRETYDDSPAAVSTPDAEPSPSHRCPHGNNRRRCVPCRAANKRQRDHAAAAAPSVTVPEFAPGQTHCEHGLKIRYRPDNSLACQGCRRGLPGKESSA